MIYEIAKTSSQETNDMTGHSNDMNFISFATPFYILDFIGFKEIPMLLFALYIWYTILATSVNMIQTGPNGPSSMLTWIPQKL